MEANKENKESKKDSKKGNKRKVMRSWEKDEVKRLIEEYEARADLWDPSRQNYHNR